MEEELLDTDDEGEVSVRVEPSGSNATRILRPLASRAHTCCTAKADACVLERTSE